MPQSTKDDTQNASSLNSFKTGILHSRKDAKDVVKELLKNSKISEKEILKAFKIVSQYINSERILQTMDALSKKISKNALQSTLNEISAIKQDTDGARKSITPHHHHKILKGEFTDSVQSPVDIDTFMEKIDDNKIGTLKGELTADSSNLDIDAFMREIEKTTIENRPQIHQESKEEEHRNYQRP